MSLSEPDSSPTQNLQLMSQRTICHLFDMLLHKGRDRGQQHKLFLHSECIHFLPVHVMKSDIVIAAAGFS